MLLKKLKEKKIVGMVFALSLTATFALGALSVYAQRTAERNAGDQTFQEETELNSTAELLLKDHVSEEIGRQICEKFGLEFETVSLMDMSDDMLDYRAALEYAALYKEVPLLSNGSEAEESDVWEELPLDIELCEGYAFGDAKEVIIDYCASQNIDPQNSNVGDLTVDQLFEICKLCRETSPHGK